MIKLIKNELIKIFHKKSIYIMGIIIVLFCLLNNILLKTNYNEDGTIKNSYVLDLTYEKEYLIEELNNLDANSKDDVGLYVEYKTSYDMLLISEKYEVDSWQYSIIYDMLYDPIYNINYYTYQIKDEKKLNEYQTIYNKYISWLDSDNWESFVYEEKDILNKSLEEYQNLLSSTTNKQEINNYNSNIANIKEQLIILDYRLDKKISYENSYLNDAINNYSNYLDRVKEYEEIEKMTYQEKQEYYYALSNKEINKYIIESGNNVYKINDLKTGLKDLIVDYELFILILILIIAGSIVSEEFNKGTIKLLLVKPYSRFKILLSKYLTTIIILLISITFTFICEFIIGSIFFGIDSLSIPIVVYNYNIMGLELYNVFHYMLIIIITKLPMLILILTLAFAISTIFGNTAIAISLTILGYLSGELINSIALSYNLNWIRYFVTPNWNFTEYLFGGLPTFENVNLQFSIIICIIYLIVMLGITFIVFKKKNIKNI